MSFPDLRAFLAQLERDGALVTVDAAVDSRP
jgi:3-polyprenyl-4-hydroxybenzoate decarboxylase